MMRDGPNDNAPFVSLMIYPAKTDQIELPDWQVKLITRINTGERTNTDSVSFSLTEPAVTWGRLTGYVWLRLQRKENNFAGSISYDGKTWQQLSSVVVPLKKNLFTGFSVSSGMPDLTTVFFDHASIRRSK